MDFIQDDDFELNSLKTVKLISILSDTYWKFTDDISTHFKYYTCMLHLTKDRGYVVTSRVPFLRGDKFASEKLVSSIITGKHREKICFWCRRTGHRTAKRCHPSSDFNACSDDCLNDGDDFVDTCYEIFSSFDSKENKDLLKLAVSILYSRRLHGKAYFDRIMCLYCHDNDPNDGQGYYFHNIIQSLQPSLLCSGDSPVSFQRLLCIIQLNSYSIPFIGYPSTFLLCISPTFARLNHSCQPNAQICFRVENDRSIVLSLCASRQGACGDEITVSYLSNPMARRGTRATLLQEAFGFTCTCRRCQRERLSAENGTQSSLPTNPPVSSLCSLYTNESNGTSTTFACDTSSLCRQLELQPSVCLLDHEIYVWLSERRKFLKTVRFAIEKHCTVSKLSALTPFTVDDNNVIDSNNALQRVRWEEFYDDVDFAFRAIERTKSILMTEKRNAPRNAAMILLVKLCDFVCICWDVVGCSSQTAKADWLLQGALSATKIDGGDERAGDVLETATIMADEAAAIYDLYCKDGDSLDIRVDPAAETVRVRTGSLTPYDPMALGRDKSRKLADILRAKSTERT